ncbi:MAG: transporter, partial [Lentisphaeria bacterium]|nr:transporter [Lentisphaeria bacterium]
PVMAAAAIRCGIGVDYGILVLHALESKKDSSILHSITISAVTTFAGGATVAFARHPMLHDAGITLLIGITVIWATAMFLLPVLYKARR